MEDIHQIDMARVTSRPDRGRDLCSFQDQDKEAKYCHYNIVQSDFRFLNNIYITRSSQL